MSGVVNRKRVATNTILLYLRMLITMSVSLYTSRVVLQTLGINDYGIYQAVGGIVGMFSFLNSALSMGSSRFLTFALGEGNSENQKIVFNSTFIAHLFLGIVILFFAETVGLYFLYNYMNLPCERMDVIFWIYQLSILVTLVLITQVPYSASIISHERMNIYAYMSILEVSLKLLILYLLVISDIDKLLLYAILLCVVQMLIAGLYRLYCMKHFEECHINWKWNKKVMKKIASFSSWSLLSNISVILNNQGIILLLNIFFTPAIVAARAISIQVNMAVNQFVENFRIAINPQIVKNYASGNKEESQLLVLESAKISFVLILLIGLPLLINCPIILNIWLGDVPPLTNDFVQLIILQSFFQTIDTSLYYGLYTIGKVKENSLISPVIAIAGFPISYVLFKMGYSPIALSWCYVVIYMIIGLVVKPILLIKLAKYSIIGIRNMIIRCLVIGLVALNIYYLCVNFINFESAWLSMVVSTFLCILLIFISAFFWGIDKRLRLIIIDSIRKK